MAAKKKEQTTYADTSVREGGLMRCCEETIAEYVMDHATTPIENGLVLDCKYEQFAKKQIILLDAAWQWNKDGREWVSK